MSEDKKALIEFAKGLKWEEYIEDPVVHSSLEKIRETVQKSQKQRTPASQGTGNPGSKPKEDVDVTGAKRVKLVVVGDGAVGKTSLLISYATGEFPTEYLPTVFENYTAQMKRDNEVILLHLWDTAGQEDYDRLRPLSYPGADVVLLCFSTINQASHDAIKEKWAPEIHHYIPGIPTIVVGTKIDLRAEKHPDPNTGKFEPILPEIGTEMAKQIDATKYMEVCSKTGQGVADVFQEAVGLVLKDREEAKGTSDSKESNGNGKKKPKGKKKDSNCLLL